LHALLTCAQLPCCARVHNQARPEPCMRNSDRTLLYQCVQQCLCWLSTAAFAVAVKKWCSCCIWPARSRSRSTGCAIVRDGICASTALRQQQAQQSTAPAPHTMAAAGADMPAASSQLHSPFHCQPNELKCYPSCRPMLCCAAPCCLLCHLLNQVTSL
jgi:hypothetical protein